MKIDANPLMLSLMSRYDLDECTVSENKPNTEEHFAESFVKKTETLYTQLRRKIEDSPAIDMQRVQLIRDKIASNGFTMNTEHIADKIISFESDLFDATDI